MFERIIIIGLGLLGGSLAKGLKRLSSRCEITAFARTPLKIQNALKEGVLSRIESIDNIVLAGADLIVITAPVISSIDLIKKILERSDLEPQSLVIDVGSVKAGIINEAEKHEKAGQFIGCHPMAGSEKMGYNNSRADLYTGESVIITPNNYNSDQDVEIIKGLWEKLGARTVLLPAPVHDILLAYTSHLPHVISCQLVETVIKGFKENSAMNIQDFIGNGFRDTTRISMGSPDMWADIMETNRLNLIESLKHFTENLKNFIEMLENKKYSDVRQFFNSICEKRESL